MSNVPSIFGLEFPLSIIMDIVECVKRLGMQSLASKVCMTLLQIKHQKYGFLWMVCISKPGRLDEFTGQGSGAYKDPTKVHLEPTRILSLL